MTPGGVLGAMLLNRLAGAAPPKEPTDRKANTPAGPDEPTDDGRDRSCEVTVLVVFERAVLGRGKPEKIRSQADPAQDCEHNQPAGTPPHQPPGHRAREPAGRRQRDLFLVATRAS
jgi:hypothetical protein